MRTLKFLTSVMITLVLFASCRKSENKPIPDEGVIGDWITLAGTNYYNIKFSYIYTYSISSFGGDGGVQDQGIYSVDTENKTITLTPDRDGAAPRTWSYKYVNDDELSVVGKITGTETQPLTLTLTRQASDEFKTVTVHSTATKAELTPQMLLGSSKIKLEGEISQGDFSVLKECEPMQELDMSAVKIVGDITVMIDSENVERKVDGNAIPSGAFGEIMSQDANTTLKHIILPSSLEVIGQSALAGCNIEEIVIPEKVNLLMMQAFSRCTQMTKVQFPENTEGITMDMAVFEFCNKLSGTINFPKGEGVSAGTFRGCSNIEGVVLPAGAIAIGEYAFIGCRKLKSINFPAELEQIYSYAFHNCTSLTGSLTLPENMRSIGTYAFSDTGYDGTLTIPQSVMDIQDNAFTFTEFKSIVLNWKEGEDNPETANASYWFPTQFKVDSGDKTIKIPVGQLTWYESIIPSIYNLVEQ